MDYHVLIDCVTLKFCSQTRTDGYCQVRAGSGQIMQPDHYERLGISGVR